MGQELSGLVDQKTERERLSLTAGQAQIHAKSWHGLASPERPGHPTIGSADVLTHANGAGEQIEAPPPERPRGWDTEHLFSPPSPPHDAEARANHKYGIAGPSQKLAEARRWIGLHHKRGFRATAEC